ncbi:MAG TPA: hypothetical protein DHV15_01370 [Treponema sp.]|uniref:Uncharacterized protein n=1 Tax=Treponema denticola (strain ATCC 35405 / DSM 14222 / CIP 103919 / JCM 8153 / KCTC 15104) TaxID=243275 RepID=Q73RJ4_TREDE|nr:hypothetical protein TDE_0094 [Treponema denticola ATCC 35405]HCY94151.1 hypothetical protein [Treponema sp.]
MGLDFLEITAIKRKKLQVFLNFYTKIHKILLKSLDLFIFLKYIRCIKSR